MIILSVASRAEAWIETRAARSIWKGAWVASRAEAWIETRIVIGALALELRVASRAEAWIETVHGECPARVARSPPARRRGSKHRVALELQRKSTSPPARRRGSKPAACCSMRAAACRLPRGGVDRNIAEARAAGLVPLVASRAEAWIETIHKPGQRNDDRVASRAEAWIETVFGRGRAVAGSVASRAEAWIETRC